MQRMRPSVRLYLTLAVIVLSALYAVVVSQDPAIASAIASGYVAMLVTVLVVINVWKKP